MRRSRRRVWRSDAERSRPATDGAQALLDFAEDLTDAFAVEANLVGAAGGLTAVCLVALMPAASSRIARRSLVLASRMKPMRPCSITA